MTATSTEQHVRGVIARNVAEVMQDVSAADVDFGAALADYGCNSVDRADIVSMTMDDLGVDVPVTELSRVTNLQELSDALCRQVEPDGVRHPG